MDFLTTHTNAALSEFEKVSDITSELTNNRLFFEYVISFMFLQVVKRCWQQLVHKLNKLKNNVLFLQILIQFFAFFFVVIQQYNSIDIQFS